MKKSTWLHLRVPFSYFLMPVFLFALAVAPMREAVDAGLVFFILHLLVYPASNGFNSYFDKDEQSIGGLKHPPKVSKELYNVALIMDGAALLLGLLLSIEFVFMILIYGAISKAYSHPFARLKKYPVYGWLAAGVFQGYFTFLTCLAGFGLSLDELVLRAHQIPAVLSSLLLFASYPMTQVYQHEEDLRRGDITISIKLGILGTFHFAAIFFFFSASLFACYFMECYSQMLALFFVVALTPALVYFVRWYWKVRRDFSEANFDHTMRLNMISSTCLNLFFITWLLLF